MKYITLNVVNTKKVDYNIKSKLEIKRYIKNKAINKMDIISTLNKDLLERKLKESKYRPAYGGLINPPRPTGGGKYTPLRGGFISLRDKNYDLLSILTNIDYLVKTYTLIKNKSGNMTKGVDYKILDKIDLNNRPAEGGPILILSNLIKSGKFNFNPIILKSNSHNSKLLTLFSSFDIIVQKAITILLESI